MCVKVFVSVFMCRANACMGTYMCMLLIHTRRRVGLGAGTRTHTSRRLGRGFNLLSPGMCVCVRERECMYVCV
jgi:hypothetical protein